MPSVPATEAAAVAPASGALSTPVGGAAPPTTVLDGPQHAAQSHRRQPRSMDDSTDDMNRNARDSSKEGTHRSPTLWECFVRLSNSTGSAARKATLSGHRPSMSISRSLWPIKGVRRTADGDRRYVASLSTIMVGLNCSLSRGGARELTACPCTGPAAGSRPSGPCACGSRAPWSAPGRPPAGCRGTAASGRTPSAGMPGRTSPRAGRP
jgi:hypothetical protein